MTDDQVAELKTILKQHGVGYLEKTGQLGLRQKLEATVDKLIDRTTMVEAPKSEGPPSPQQVVDTMREKARKYITKLGHPALADTLGDQVAAMVQKGIQEESKA